MQEASGSTVTDTGLEQPATLKAAQAKQWRPASSRPTRAVCINRPEAPTSLFRRFLQRNRQEFLQLHAAANPADPGELMRILIILSGHQMRRVVLGDDRVPCE